MANTIWKEVFLIMCSSSKENARNTERFPLTLRITDNYTLQTLCGAPHNVCNEEGKLDGLSLNRAVYADPSRREMLDIIAGTCFVCSCSGEDFGSLSPEQLHRYTEQFKYPEKFFRVGDDIKAVPFLPERNQER